MASADMEVDKVAEAVAVEPTATTSAVEPSAEPQPSTSSSPSAEDEAKVIKQVEFYFADANLPFDKFMWGLYSKDPEHWIPIATIASFKRMREYQPHGNEWLVQALKKSDLLEVDAEGKKVRRTTEVKEPKAEDAFARSVYAKGFPEEDSTLQKRLEEFFGEYGPTNSVRMRRDENKKFKTSVFAEFKDIDTVDKFLKADPKPTFDGKELLIMTKGAYCDMKIKEKGLTGKAANSRRDALAKGRGFNAFAETKQEQREIVLEYIGNRIPVKMDSEGNGVIDAKDVPYVAGATLRFDGCGGDCTWSDIKEPVKQIFDGKPPYIKFSRGDDFGLVGFHKALTEEEQEKVKAAIKQINGKDVTWTLPTEEDEKTFQVERAQVAARAAVAQLNGGGSRDSRRGGGGRGGRGGGRGAGGRGGRGGRGVRGGGRGNGRDRNAERDSKPAASADAGAEDGATGEKRKRAVEPDGGPFMGVRGANAPPAIGASADANTAKKVKTGDGSAAPTS